MNSSYQQKIEDIKAKIIHYLPIVLNWVWKNIVVNSYKFRILELLLYLFFMVVTTDFDGSSAELYFRLTCFGMVMILINVSYGFNEYSEFGQDKSYGIKILFNNHRTRLIGFTIGILLFMPYILLVGTGLLIIFGGISILWISIKYIISVFKK